MTAFRVRIFSRPPSATNASRVQSPITSSPAALSCEASAAIVASSTVTVCPPVLIASPALGASAE